MQDKNEIDSTYFDILKTDEMKAFKETNEVFGTEIPFAEEELDLYLRTFQILSKSNVQQFSNSKDASYRIAYRIFRTIRCAFNCALYGYCDVSMILLRTAYENHLLMNFLSKREHEARKWFKGKCYSPKFLRENVTYADNSLYRRLCEFVHSSFKSTLWFTSVEKDEMIKAVIGEFDRSRFSQVITLVLMTLTTTMILLSLTFPSELIENKTWHRRFKMTIPRIWKYLRKRK